MEQPIKRTREQVEAEIRAVQESNRRVEKTLAQATQALTAAGETEGQNSNAKIVRPPRKEPLKNKVLRTAAQLGLAGVVAGGGIYGAKPLGKYTGNTIGKGTAINESASKEDKIDFYRSKARDIHEEAKTLQKIEKEERETKERIEREKIEAERKAKEEVEKKALKDLSDVTKPTTSESKTNAPTVEEITERLKAVFDKERAEEKAAYSNELVKIREEVAKKPIEKPGPRTIEELIDAVDRGESLKTAQEADRYNREAGSIVAARRAARMAETVQVAPRREVPRAPTVRPENLGYRDATGPNPDFAVQQMQMVQQQMMEKNPFNLSKKALEEVEIVYEKNLDKLFPDGDPGSIWISIKNRRAYELMNTPEDRIPQTQQILFHFLKEIEKVTGEKPQGSMSIEKYIERGLQKAAAEKKLKKLVPKQ